MTFLKIKPQVIKITTSETVFSVKDDWRQNSKLKFQ